jgi:Peptidase family M13
MGLDGPEAIAPTAMELPTRVSDCMDCSVDPCEDFHRYACGRWMTAFERSKPTAAMGLAEVTRQNERHLHEIFTNLERRGARTSSPEARFLAACVDDDDRVAAGTTALQPALASIDAVSDAAGFLRASGELARMGVSGPFSFHVSPSTAGQALLISTAPLGSRLALGAGAESPVQRYLVRTFVALGDSAERAQVRAAAVRTLRAPRATARPPRHAPR